MRFKSDGRLSMTEIQIKSKHKLKELDRANTFNWLSAARGTRELLANPQYRHHTTTIVDDDCKPKQVKRAAV